MPEKQGSLPVSENGPEVLPAMTRAKAAEVVPTGAGAVAQKEKMGQLRGLVDKLKASIMAVAPRHLTPERLAKLALVAAQRQPRLLECTAQSWMFAIMQSAELGLEPGSALGHAYFVPFRNKKKRGQPLEVVFVPGYRGLIYLANNSGEIESIEAEVVHQNDKFDYVRGYGAESGFLRHQPNLDDPGALRLVYAMAWTKGSNKPTSVVMTKTQVEHVKKRSQNTGPDSPWQTDPEEMWKKTAIKRICKLLPLSPEKDQMKRFLKAAAADELAPGEIQIDPLEGMDFEDEGEEISKTEALANSLARGAPPA